MTVGGGLPYPSEYATNLINIHKIIIRAHTVEPTWLLPFLGQPAPVFLWCV